MNGDIKPTQFMARREDYQDGVSLYSRKVIEGVGSMSAEPVVYSGHTRNTPVEPFLFLSIHEAQQLIDELWQCGLRPTEGVMPAGGIAATQLHLEDFRRIVFDKLKMGEPK